MEPDEARVLTVVEMATHRISNAFMKLGDGLGLGEDRFTGSVRIEPALHGLFNDKDDLVHDLAPER
jgi:hypothetical protein